MMVCWRSRGQEIQEKQTKMLLDKEREGKLNMEMTQGNNMREELWIWDIRRNITPEKVIHLPIPIFSENILGNRWKSHSCLVGTTKNSKGVEYSCQFTNYFKQTSFYGRSRGSCTADNHEDTNRILHQGLWMLTPETSNCSPDLKQCKSKLLKVRKCK